MICAIMLPTRARPDRLHTTIRSVLETVSDLNEIEILLRLDDDDEVMLTRLAEFEAYPRMRIIIGNRENGYASLGDFYNELALATKATWLWVMNDDATITGKGWDEKLKAVPTTGFIVQPWLHQLGASKYYNNEGGAFPVFPNGSWRPHWESLHDPIDTAIDGLLRIQLGWKTHFLPDIGVVHDRDNDEQLASHRAMP